MTGPIIMTQSSVGDDRNPNVRFFFSRRFLKTFDRSKNLVDQKREQEKAVYCPPEGRDVFRRGYANWTQQKFCI